MAPNKVTKKLHYLRVINSSGLINLAQDISELKKRKPLARDSLIVNAGVNYEIMHYKESNKDEVFLHISSSETGRTSISMNMQCEALEDNGKIQLPPKDHEYVTKEAYVLIKNHHVFFCGHGLTYLAVSSYLNKLLYQDEEDYTRHVAFDPVANVDTLTIIQKQGVKEIVFDSSLYEMSLEKVQSQKPQNLSTFMSTMVGTLKEKLATFIDKDLSEEEQKMMEQLHVGVSLRLKGNSRAELSSKRKIQDAAQDVILNKDLKDGIKIITSDNVRISGDDTKLQTSVSLSRLGRSNSLECQGVWDALEDYCRELEARKLTEV